MSIQIPQNMGEVEAQLMDRRNHGEQVTADEVIKDAVRDILQALMDEALEGHYDDVKWDDQGKNLIIYSLGKSVGKVAPAKATFIEEFKTNPDDLMLHLDQAVTKIVTGR